MLKVTVENTLTSWKLQFVKDVKQGKSYTYCTGIKTLLVILIVSLTQYLTPIFQGCLEAKDKDNTLSVYCF